MVGRREGGALTEEKIFNIYASERQLCLIVRAKASPKGHRPGEKQNSEDREKEGPLVGTATRLHIFTRDDRERESTKHESRQR